MGGERTFLTRVLGPVERLVYRGSRTNPDARAGLEGVRRSLLVFSLASSPALYALLRAQGLLPVNPDGSPPRPEPHPQHGRRRS